MYMEVTKEDLRARRAQTRFGLSALGQNHLHFMGVSGDGRDLAGTFMFAKGSMPEQIAKAAERGHQQEEDPENSLFHETEMLREAGYDASERTSARAVWRARQDLATSTLWVRCMFSVPSTWTLWRVWRDFRAPARR